jgi:hypothetical protein
VDKCLTFWMGGRGSGLVVIIVGASAVLKKQNQQNPNKPLSRFKKKEKLVTPIRQGMDANQQRQTSSGAKPLSPTRLGTCTIPMRVSCWSAATCSFSERPAGRFFGSRPVTNPFLTNTTGDFWELPLIQASLPWKKSPCVLVLDAGSPEQ